ncbi:uncharacterized protein ColSpa_09954 [Colletotrichum spaethianum]|uniref:Uncharacterized protein n=1 Tax=Colletotrichum spaethianum TaxID=700344 RepID=A0AA37USE3_9PEZI|nr:uncharacterized protein ColSpa_09954 [Colletotrichum spaethianum]GKT49773.1 hypothetical protein ColSpa_09954 [Colletotrichum spaethianum]
MDFRIFRKSKSAGDVADLASNDIIPVRRITSNSMAYALAAQQKRPEVDMATVWKSIDAPRSTLKIDNSTFFLPAGPMADDKFWMVLANGDIGMVTKNGFVVEDSGVKYHVKRKDRSNGFTFHCGTLTIILHPSKSLRRCFIGHGAMAEKRIIMRLQADCQYAADKVTNCMASMLWYNVQSHGSMQWRTETNIADDLEKAAQALSELVDFAARFIKVMRRQYQGDGREETMPAAYKNALKLLVLAKWYRIHRALNSVQCMEKAFRRSVDRSAHPAAQHRSDNFIQSNLLGMLGWGLAPGSMGSQRDVLQDVLTTLEVLGTTDWGLFEEKDVRARMEQTATTVRIVKEASFTIWTQQKIMRFLRHRPLRGLDPAEVRLAGQESRSEESIHPSHLRMLKVLPWVKNFDAGGRVPILRLAALD